MEKILISKIQCNECGDIIQSKHRHDFGVFLDGGLSYQRIGGRNYMNITNLSVYAENNEINENN